MTKEERIQLLESRVTDLRTELHTAEWELEKARGEGHLLDQLFQDIDASGRSYEEVIEFLKVRD